MSAHGDPLRDWYSPVVVKHHWLAPGATTGQFARTPVELIAAGVADVMAWPFDPDTAATITNKMRIARFLLI